jgi:hypothetical protein
MSDRLSEEALIRSLDSGWRSLVWRDPFSSKNSQLTTTVDLNAILHGKDPEALAHAVPRRDMYLAIVAAGAEEALDVLPLLSDEQFVSIIDNEAWRDGHLAVHQAIRWLDLYKHLGPEQLYKRFRQLDEEYQVALLNPYIEMVDEEAFEKLPQEEQDRFTALPCNTLWWKVKGGDEKVQEFVSSLIGASISEDAAYVYSLLGMSAMLPPNEQEALLKQFRDARLEEDGFVSTEESLELFAPFAASKALLDKWSGIHRPVSTTLTKKDDKKVLFLDSVLRLASSSGMADSVAVENVQKGFAYLANAVSAACQVESDDVAGLTSLLQQVKCMSSFGLEVLSKGDESKAIEVLFTEYPKVVFKFALSLFDAIRLEAISGLQARDDKLAKKVELYWRAGKFGAALWMLDKNLAGKMEPESVEILKGLFNRFPMVKDDVITDDKVWRVRFRPVAANNDYDALMADVRRVFTDEGKEKLQ